MKLTLSGCLQLRAERSKEVFQAYYIVEVQECLKIKYISQQECIPAGWVPSAAVAAGGKVVSARGVSTQRWGCLPGGVVSAQEGVSAQGECLPSGGVCLGEGVSARGKAVYLPRRGVCQVHAGIHPPP